MPKKGSSTLVVNLKTAKAEGVTVRPALLVQRLIE
jgi:hypothetical protein